MASPLNVQADDEEDKAPVPFLKEHEAWVKFIPAVIAWPIWLYTMADGSHWSGSFEEYWPMTVAMIAGSFIAGSTPLGGGIIAFPVSVLVLDFAAGEARDISVLIQAVGMNAAAYLLFVTKPHLLNPEFIISFAVTGTIGIIIGLIVEPQPKIMNVLYTLLVFEFGIIFFYTNVLNPLSKREIDPIAQAQSVGPFGNGKLAFWVGRGIMLVFGVVGGIITSTIGSGSDIFLFLYGLYAWNIIYPNKQYPENSFTASSVVVMGIVSAVTALLRALNGGYSQKALYTWGAMIPIVVLGAPIGSIVITPRAVPYLRLMFYFLAMFQFIMFSALKIKGQINQWITIIVVTIAVLLLLTYHYHKYRDYTEPRHERKETNSDLEEQVSDRKEQQRAELAELQDVKI